MTPEIRALSKGTLGKRFSKPENLLARRTRAATFIVDMVNGLNQREIARKYNVSQSTVRNEIAWAERSGMFERAQDAITNRLIPLALDVFEKALKKHLESGEFEAAEKLLDKVGAFSAVKQQQLVTTEEASEGDELTWEKFTLRRAAAQAPTLAEFEEAAQETFEGEVVTDGSEE